MSFVSRVRRKLDRMWSGEGFAFVHINKCGGTSIRRALNLDIVHRDAAQLQADFGARRWQRMYSFTLIRNPYARAISLYNYRVQTNQTGMGDGHIGFEDWLYAAFVQKDLRYYDKPMMFRPCRAWIVDARDAIIVKQIFKLEEIDQAWPVIQQQTGATAALPRENVTKRVDLAAAYSPASRKLVAEVFAADLETFGYTFPEAGPASPPAAAQDPAGAAV